MDEYNDYSEFDSTDLELEDGSVITDVNCKGKDYTIGSLINLWNNQELKIPEFQRKYVWKIEQASKFIESLMLGLPIPSLMFYEDSDSYLLIIDGQQRIKSILLFVGAINKENATRHEKSMCNFTLTGLAKDSPYYNKSYADFTDKEKRMFKNKSSLYINLISLKDPENLTSIYHIFERLNTGGTLLTAQEIRNCIFSGSFNDFIIKLNEYDNWKKFITNKSSESHQTDVELILRFFALYDMIIPYKRPMKDYLSLYMKIVRNMSKEEMIEKQKIFTNTVDSIYNNLGVKPFHIKNGLNSSVLDSVMIAFAHNLDNIPKDIVKKYEQLCSNSEYYKYCGKSSNDKESVKNRLQMAEDFLFGKVDSIELKLIKLYSLPASAGNGNILFDDNTPYVEISTTNRKADFALKISGDSMEPEIPNGSIVLIKRQDMINSGQIGIFLYDGEIRCKKFYKNKKNISLISINKQYSPLNISSNRRLDILGVVIDVQIPQNMLN
ncbi:MAG: DUF262 domain-containing protein [Lachnospiraceae bacterium]|nr:DUF262 domain-containing protein [Lachnospiraceae bacterium]